MQSGLKRSEKERAGGRNQEVKVSPFRLGAHLTTAFVILSLFTRYLVTMMVQPDYVSMDIKLYRRVRWMALGMSVSFFITF